MGARRAATAALIGATTLACGCGPQSPLDPKSDQARDIASLWWWMLAIASVVFLGAVALLLAAWVFRAREGIPFFEAGRRFTTGLVVVFGIVIPLFILVGVFIVANFVVLKSTDAPGATTSLKIDVTGHQWFWEVRYPGTTAVTANEIHIPARTRVTIVARTDDVIHSFWIPQLNRKIDTIPGHPNRLLLYADAPGRYRGQCAEYCGLQHAKMAFLVIAEPPDSFAHWLARQRDTALTPTDELTQRGQEVFLGSTCPMCHAISGTPAGSRVGPDLTHLASRRTIAAGTLPNTRGNLAGWIVNPQSIKPGTKMPANQLEPADLQALLAYLETLK
jgi:cytochrome c oxidase subunit II